jgi:hypothetical protein
MRPQTLTATALAQNATTAWVPLDIQQSPFNVSLGLVITSGTWDVQHTFDDVFDSSVTPTAFTHSSLTGETASIDGNYAYPVTAVRLKQTAASPGTASLIILQGKG